MSIFNIAPDLKTAWESDSISNVIQLRSLLAGIESRCGDERAMYIYLEPVVKGLKVSIFDYDETEEIATFELLDLNNDAANSGLISSLTHLINLRIVSDNVLELCDF